MQQSRTDIFARLIVGAMTIDGSLSKAETEHVAATLHSIGMDELIGDIGVAIEEDDGSFNMFEECKNLMESLGSNATEMAPMIFRVITDVIASDRYISMNEATYLSGIARRLGLSNEKHKRF